MFESILCRVTEHDPTFSSPLLALQSRLLAKARGKTHRNPIHTGDENAVLARSRALILDPLLGHPEVSRHVTNLNLRGTIKELAQLDGAFVVIATESFSPLAATSMPWPRKWTCRGLGSRHIAAANMSAVTEAVGIAVS